MPKSIAGNCLLQQQKLDNVSSSANNKITFIWLCEIKILAVFSVFWPVVCLHSGLIFLTAFAYDAHFHLSHDTAIAFEKREMAAQNLPRFETKNGPDLALYLDRYTQVFRSIPVADWPKSIAGNCLLQQQKLDNVSSSANNKIAFIWLCEIKILAVFSVFWPVVCLHSELIFLTVFAYDAHFQLSHDTSFRFEKREKSSTKFASF